MRTPRVGDTVLYQSYGTPKGEFQSAARAALVTEVDPDEPARVGLVVHNPTGTFFHSLAQVRALPAGEREELEAVRDEARRVGGFDAMTREVLVATIRDLADRLLRSSKTGGCTYDATGTAGGTWRWPDDADDRAHSL